MEKAKNQREDTQTRELLDANDTTCLILCENTTEQCLILWRRFPDTKPTKMFPPSIQLFLLESSETQEERRVMRVNSPGGGSYPERQGSL